MNLIEINASIFDKLKNKKIILCVNVKGYFRELEQKYHVLNRVAFVVDNYDRKQGYTECEEYRFPVYSFDYLNNINIDNYLILITSEYYEEVYRQGEGMFPDYINTTIYYYADARIHYYNYYRNLFKNKPLENKIIFCSGARKAYNIESGEFDDNSLALFEYMLENKLNTTYQLVWVVLNPEKYKQKYSKYENVSFLPYRWSESKDINERRTYYVNICLAKYFFFTQATDIATHRREGQIRVQLWHGQGIKSRALFTHDEYRYEYMTVMSEKYGDMHAEIFGLRKDQILVTGNPKQDWLYHPFDKGIFEVLEIPKADKYVFWLPTMRDSKAESFGDKTIYSDTGLTILESKQQLDRINKLLNGWNMVLIIKQHPFEKYDLRVANLYSNIVVLNNDMLSNRNININQLLGYADALISDYSSAAIDYMLLDRPIAFAIPDLDVYKSSRKLHFDNLDEWLPGIQITTESQFCDFIKEVRDGVDSGKKLRQNAFNKLGKWRDDNNCKRVLEALHII